MPNIKKIKLKEENEFNDLINITMIKCFKDANKICHRIEELDFFCVDGSLNIIAVSLFKERMKHAKLN